MGREKRYDRKNRVILTNQEEKLRTVLLESGLTYPEISERTGGRVSVPTISRFLGRSRGLTSESFCLLMQAMFMDVFIQNKDGTFIGIQVKKELPVRPTGRPPQKTGSPEDDSK